MLVVKCSSCGTKTVVPDDRPPEIVCSGCKKTLKLHYPETEPAKAGLLTKIKKTASNAASASVSLVKRHPKIVVGGILSIVGVVSAVYFAHSDADTSKILLSDNNFSVTPDLLPDSSSTVPTTSYTTEADTASDDEMTDGDYLGWLTNHCRNCGNSLEGGYYTDPWEDGDNEYGYWICPYCGAINEDWNSVDDDD